MVDRLRKDLTARGLIEFEGGKFKLTPAGLAYTDQLLEDLKRKSA